mmetsp:Transcript_5531/g.15247  ORF Transcript_5531/g.15247 Transcript_5531/m.15247 type:complete len:167 (+) Transcript_5531:2-502(+)
MALGLAVLVCAAAVHPAQIGQPSLVSLSKVSRTHMSASSGIPLDADPCTLPGDPSLVLHTNVKLEDKAAFMSAASKAIEAALGKPESYIAVCVHDGTDLIWGGSDAPAAVGCLYSIGSIAQESNGAFMATLCGLLAKQGVPAERVYVNFFDVPRANVGWNGRTFAG